MRCWGRCRAAAPIFMQTTVARDGACTDPSTPTESIYHLLNVQRSVHKMQFTWNIAQGVSSYNKQTGFGFVIGAVYNANAALRSPETNSSFWP